MVIRVCSLTDHIEGIKCQWYEIDKVLKAQIVPYSIVSELDDFKNQEGHEILAKHHQEDDFKTEVYRELVAFPVRIVAWVSNEWSEVEDKW